MSLYKDEYEYRVDKPRKDDEFNMKVSMSSGKRL